MLSYIISFISSFIISDIILNYFDIEGRYYINHFIGNMIVVAYTADNVIASYTNDNFSDHNLFVANSAVYAIHLYHIIWYYYRLRKNDLLHHGIMIGLTLPITNYFLPPDNLLGYCFFFTTGLPGGIDYLLLALVRNNIIRRDVEKEINKQINLWLRCPGCISGSTLILYKLSHNYQNYTELFASLFVASTVYWNGIYYMEQIVSNQN